MTSIAKKGWTTVCIVLLLAALLWPSPDVYALNNANLRQLTRGLLWNGFRNGGTQGGVINQTASRGTCRNTYPGMGYGIMLMMTGPDWIEYWGIKPGYSWANAKQEAQNTSAGAGVWVLTKANGETGASYSGLFLPSDDIVPMYYDIANSPEADWGYDIKVPARGIGAGTSMGNWYPGAPEKTGPAIAGVPYETLNYRFGQYPDADKDNRPEDAIFSKWTTKHGITISRKAYAWSYQGFDDFFILELEFENTGDSDGDGVADVNGGAGFQLDDTYFAFGQMFVISQAAYYNQGMPGDRNSRPEDDVFRYTDAPDYDGPAAYAPLKVNYARDGDSIEDFAEDTGEPQSLNSSYLNEPGGRQVGQLYAYQYAGVAPLAYRDAGATHAFNPNDVGLYVNPVGEQPHASNWWLVQDIRRSTDAPNLAKNSADEIYDQFTAPTDPSPQIPQTVIDAQTYGPYNLAPGDKAKIVVAYVAGSGANAIARPGQPKYSIDVETFAVLDIPLEENERLDRVAKGEEALMNHVGAAQFAYDSMYDIPDYPPDVAFAVASNENAQNGVSWAGADAAVNPDYGEADIAGYRVFRSSWKEFGPWELKATIPAGSSGATWTYSGGTYDWGDAEAISGFSYFYNVRAYTTPHSSWTNGINTMADLPSEVQGHLQAGLEGGYSAGTQRDNQSASPYMPGTTSGDAVEKEIFVVPNPFSLSVDGHNYQSSLKIRFVGIPTKCRILIYNFAGEIVGQLDHDDPSSGETAWFHKERNLAVLEVATGIYFYVVESLLPGSMGKKARGTFYVIR